MSPAALKLTTLLLGDPSEPLRSPTFEAEAKRSWVAAVEGVGLELMVRSNQNWIGNLLAKQPQRPRDVQLENQQLIYFSAVIA